MADAYQALDSLRTMLIARREGMKENLVRKRVAIDHMQEVAGQAQGLMMAIEAINDQIKSLNQGDDIDG